MILMRHAFSITKTKTVPHGGQNSDFTMKEKSSHQRVNLKGVEKRRYRLES
jgi:hypothetical protein